MNDKRRKAIDAIIADVEKQKAGLEALKAAFEAISTAIEYVQGEEQDYFDNLSERAQGSDKGQAAEYALTQLGEALAWATEVADIDADCDDIVRALDEAKGTPE